MALQFKLGLIVLALATAGLTSPCIGQTPQPLPVPSPEPQHVPVPVSGSINGTIVDQSGAVVAGAPVKLTIANQSRSLEALSADDGQFSFANVPPGAFLLTITAAGFATQTSSGILLPGEIHVVPQIALAVAANITDVQVSLSRVEVAEAQVKDEEKQRVLGFIPNFYVTYDPHPVALTSKQKFELAWRTTIDPVTFAGTFIGSAILPSLLKQDPRYFYKGTGSTRSRSLYAIANAVVCKGDNGRWQVNYSNILGSLAAGAISNLYYPAQNRNGAALTFENAAIGIGATAAANLVEEFLMRKLTSNANRESAKP